MSCSVEEKQLKHCLCVLFYFLFLSMAPFNIKYVSLRYKDLIFILFFFVQLATV